MSILRAGNGILDAMLELIPSARVGHIGIYRDPATLTPVEYYFKMPPEISQRDVVVVDPMLATGNSAAAAISRVKQLTPLSIKFVCLIASMGRSNSGYALEDNLRISAKLSESSGDRNIRHARP